MSVPNVSPAQSFYAIAEKQFKSGDYQQAFKSLIPAFQADYNYKPNYYLAKEIFGKQNQQEERRLMAIAILDFDQFQSFFDLGYHCVEIGEYELASPFLEKALSLNPENLDVAYELAFSLMARFRIQHALDVLSSVNYHYDFWVAYLFYQCRLWTGQPEGVQDFVDDARALLSAQGVPDEGTELAYEKIAELQLSLHRFLALETTNTHIRDWHFIQYGAAILNYHHATNETLPAGGRYITLDGDYAQVRLILNNLRTYLEVINFKPQRLVAVPDDNSEVITAALARLLGCEYILLEQVEDYQDCLIIGASNESFNGIEPLIKIQGELVFAFHQQWFGLSMITADISGFVAQQYQFPWEKDEIDLSSEAQREQIVHHILTTEPAVDTALQETLTFYAAVTEHLKGLGQVDGLRAPYSVESPVGGAFFS